MNSSKPGPVHSRARAHTHTHTHTHTPHIHARIHSTHACTHSLTRAHTHYIGTHTKTRARAHTHTHTHTHTEGDQEEMRITFRPSLSNKCAILGGRDFAKRIAFLLLASLLPHLLKCVEVCACVSRGLLYKMLRINS